MARYSGRSTHRNEALVSKSKKERARVWVHSYMALGTGIVIAAVVPGATTLALTTMEGHMCYEIGKIYRGENFTLAEATRTAAAVGIAAVLGKIAALEALNFVPFAGWAVKGAVAGGIIKGLGEAIIAHYEALEPSE